MVIIADYDMGCMVGIYFHFCNSLAAKVFIFSDVKIGISVGLFLRFLQDVAGRGGKQCLIELWNMNSGQEN